MSGFASFVSATLDYPNKDNDGSSAPKVKKDGRNWLVIFDLNDASLLFAFADVCALLDRPTLSIQKCYIPIYQSPTIKCTRCPFLVLLDCL